MKVAGALTLVAGLMAAVVLALLPSTVSVFGTSGSCGLPITGMFGYSNQSDSVIADQCQQQSGVRVGIGAVVGVIALAGGLPMLLAGSSISARGMQRQHDERQRLGEWHWQEEQRLNTLMREHQERQWQARLHQQPPPWTQLPPPQTPQQHPWQQLPPPETPRQQSPTRQQPPPFQEPGS